MAAVHTSSHQTQAPSGTREEYDVVVVGGGLGGLLSAVLLAKAGLNVCVLEKDKQIGGCLQTFALHKTVFDSCVHYIGGLGEGHTLNRIFSYAGIMDKLSLKPLGEDAFDRIAFADEELSYPQAVGAGNFIEQLSTFFPKERAALENYIDLLRRTGDHFPLYRLRKGDAGEKAAVSGWELIQTLESLTQDRLLQSVLAGNNLLYAGQPGKSPFYLHSLVVESYIHSAHKILPGSSQISKFLWQELSKHGGTVIRNTEVVSLVEEDGFLRYAQTAEGDRFYGRQFISNIHPEVLNGLLISDMVRPAYKKRIAGLEQTTSAFMLNLVLKPGTVPYRDHNLYWHSSPDVWAAVSYKPGNWPLSYALYYTESDEMPGYAESLSILTYMHYDEVKEWAASVNRAGLEHTRPESYLDFKEERSERLLQRVCERVPELMGNILASLAATPVTYRDYTGTPEGALYGILKDVHKPSETTVATRTRIPNLLLTGQNINLHGVLGVSITAVATCAELIGIDHLLSKITSPR